MAWFGEGNKSTTSVFKGNTYELTAVPYSGALVCELYLKPHIGI